MHTIKICSHCCDLEVIKLMNIFLRIQALHENIWKTLMKYDQAFGGDRNPIGYVLGNIC